MLDDRSQAGVTGTGVIDPLHQLFVALECKRLHRIELVLGKHMEFFERISVLSLSK